MTAPPEATSYAGLGDLTLLLGSTGVRKADAVAALKQFGDEVGEKTQIEYCDFEREYVVRRFDGEMWSYLDALERHQRREWREAWSQMCEDLRDRDTSSRLIVGMHGVIVRDLFGARSLVDIPLVAAARPTRIINLINDVHDVWARTEERAGRGNWVGQPRIGQLLDARRMEILIGDLLAAHIDGDEAVPHRIFAVKHPARELHRLLSVPAERLRLVYLSFPITGPRDEVGRGGERAMQELNELLRRAVDRIAEQPEAVSIVPVTVDELPVVRAQPAYPDDMSTFVVEASQRWSLRDIWPEDALLTGAIDESVTLDSLQVAEAAGGMRADVAVRDYRLVEQCDRVLAINPMFQNKLAGGVSNEVAYATFLGRPVHVFQQAEHDTNGRAGEALVGTKGTFGEKPRGSYVTFHKELEEAIEAAVTN